jgi:hypothetical protein
MDAYLLNELGLSKHLETIAIELGLSRLLLSYKTCLLMHERVSLLKKGVMGSKDVFDSFIKEKNEDIPIHLGQLSLKEEAAGKIRVFALVDIWTQSICKPIHDSLFAFLKSLPNDSTFDQLAAVKRCFTKAEQSKLSFGYDLSAATDRLPIDIQVKILEAFFGSSVSQAWKSLLVDRDYVLKTEGKAKFLRYSVGQPMGALSS